MALIRKMFLWICLMSCIGLSIAVFVTLGNYSEYRSRGVNLEECGLRFVPKLINLYYNKKCFKSLYPNQTINANEGVLSIPKDESIPNRIAFGHRVILGEAPWAVYIRFFVDAREMRTCSGSLVTFEWVVTAGHCVISATVVFNRATVYAGSLERGQGDTRESFPQRWFRFSNLPTPGYDIALMKVAPPFVKTTEGRYYKLNTICLPDRGGENIEPDEAKFAAFGVKEGNRLVRWLRKGQFLLSPSNQCETPWVVCANYTGLPGRPPRTCLGDSGGGLWQYVQFNSRAVLVGPFRGSKQHGPGACGENVYFSRWVSIPRHINWTLYTINTY